jgi:hypothetical protein
MTLARALSEGLRDRWAKCDACTHAHAHAQHCDACIPQYARTHGTASTLDVRSDTRVAPHSAIVTRSSLQRPSLPGACACLLRSYEHSRHSRHSRGAIIHTAVDALPYMPHHRVPRVGATRVLSRVAQHNCPHPSLFSGGCYEEGATPTRTALASPRGRSGCSGCNAHAALGRAGCKPIGAVGFSPAHEGEHRTGACLATAGDAPHLWCCRCRRGKRGSARRCRAPAVGR